MVFYTKIDFLCVNNDEDNSGMLLKVTVESLSRNPTGFVLLSMYIKENNKILEENYENQPICNVQWKLRRCHRIL